MEVQWLHVLYEVNRKLQHKLNLVQQSGSHISILSVPQAQSVHSVFGIFTCELGF